MRLRLDITNTQFLVTRVLTVSRDDEHEVVNRH